MNILNNNKRIFLNKLDILSRADLKTSAAKSSGIAEPALKKKLEIENIGTEIVPFTLPSLSYEYDALEPYIDKMTMQIHHDKHHQAYVDNLNKALKETNLENVSLETLCKNASHFSLAIRNNAGGHYNHSLFWLLMKYRGGSTPTGPLADDINATFGSFREFKSKFSDAAKSRFGSGWAWLVLNNGKLEIGSTPNQDNPLMDISDFKGIPILGIDVWEHAYYLKYQNSRPDYITLWWNVVNWDEVAKLYAAAK